MLVKMVNNYTRQHQQNMILELKIKKKYKIKFWSCTIQMAAPDGAIAERAVWKNFSSRKLSVPGAITLVFKSVQKHAVK